MDPNATLASIHSAIQDRNTAIQNEDSDAEIDAMVDIIESFNALDVWITNGGFLPTAWQR